MKPKNVVDGWNAWFFDDLNRLRDVWPYLLVSGLVILLSLWECPLLITFGTRNT